MTARWKDPVDGSSSCPPGPFRLCAGKGDAGALQTEVHASAEDWEASTVGTFACGDETLGIPPGDLQACEALRSTRHFLEEQCAGMALDPERPFIENNAALDRSDDEIAHQFRCIAQLGVNGCFIEQPLEAARTALRTHGHRFLRDDAQLVVIFMTDETDCSFRDASILDPQRLDLGEDVGFRCHREIKGTGKRAQVLLAAITGLPDYTQAPAGLHGPGPQPADTALVWGQVEDTFGGYVLPAPSCAGPGGTAAANPRVQRLLEAFPDPATGQPSLASICRRRLHARARANRHAHDHADGHRLRDAADLA